MSYDIYTAVDSIGHAKSTQNHLESVAIAPNQGGRVKNDVIIGVGCAFGVIPDRNWKQIAAGIFLTDFGFADSNFPAVLFVTLIFVMKLTNTNTKSGKKSQSLPPFSICFWQKKFTSASTNFFGHLPLFVESTFSAPGQTRAVSVSIRTGKACHCIVVFGIAWYDSAIWFLNTDSGYKGYTFRIKWVHLIDIEAKNNSSTNCQRKRLLGKGSKTPSTETFCGEGEGGTPLFR